MALGKSGDIIPVLCHAVSSSMRLLPLRSRLSAGAIWRGLRNFVQDSSARRVYGDPEEKGAGRGSVGSTASDVPSSWMR